jgi:nucleoside-diphosphate-sugar epimerase
VVAVSLRLLGFSPSVDLESGLDRYIQWVKAQDPDLESWVEQDRTRNW